MPRPAQSQMYRTAQSPSTGGRSPLTPLATKSTADILRDSRIPLSGGSADGRRVVAPRPPVASTWGQPGGGRVVSLATRRVAELEDKVLDMECQLARVASGPEAWPGPALSTAASLPPPGQHDAEGHLARWEVAEAMAVFDHAAAPFDVASDFEHAGWTSTKVGTPPPAAWGVPTAAELARLRARMANIEDARDEAAADRAATASIKAGVSYREVSRAWQAAGARSPRGGTGQQQRQGTVPPRPAGGGGGGGGGGRRSASVYPRTRSSRS